MATTEATRTYELLIRRLVEAFNARNADAYASLVHPDAIIRSSIGGEPFRGRDGARTLVAETRDRVVNTSISTIEPIGDDTVLGLGRYQHQSPDRHR